MKFKFPKFNVGKGVLLALCVEFLLMSILSPYFLVLQNLFNILKSFSVIGIISVGMTMVIIVGGLDLSVGSMVGLGGMVTATLMATLGVPPVFAVILGILTGCFFGFLISVLVNELKINSIIVTLAMLSIIKGMTYMLSKGSNVFIKSPGVNFLGQGYIGAVPFPVIQMILIALLGFIFLNYTVIGRQIYAIGGNERASKLAGIDVKKVRRVVYILTSSLAAYCGIIMGGMLGSAEMTVGTGLELDVIAAVIIGGTSLKGGRGTVVGSLVGAAIMGILKNGFVLLGISYEAQIISIGIVILLAVSIDSFKNNRD